MKKVVIIGRGSVGMAICEVLSAQTNKLELVQKEVNPAFASELFKIKAPPLMPEIRIFDPIQGTKRNRTQRREQERKNKRK